MRSSPVTSLRWRSGTSPDPSRSIPARPPGVRVHSVKNAMFPAALEKVTVAIEKRGNRLLVEERHDGGFFMSAGTVSFDITIPQGVKVIEAHSVSGSVTIHDVPAGVDQTLTTVSGSISTARARNLDASSTSGSIQFLFDGSRLQARSVSGSIQGRIEGMDKGGSVGVRTVSGQRRRGGVSRPGCEGCPFLSERRGILRAPACDHAAAAQSPGRENPRRRGQVGGFHHQRSNHHPKDVGSGSAAGKGQPWGPSRPRRGAPHGNARSGKGLATQQIRSGSRRSTLGYIEKTSR